MNALLIYPETPNTYWSFKHALPFQGKRAAFPPLGLLTIAPLLPAHWKKRLVDTNVRRLTDGDLAWADVVFLSGMLVHKRSLLEILARCRARGLRTVVGGPVTSSVEELRRRADHVVIGEAEELVPALARDLELGIAARVYRSQQFPDLSRTPLPDLSLIHPRHYSAMSVQYSRGCPFNCEFCDIITLYGRKPRTKSPAQVVGELEQLHARHWRGPVFIVDDNFIGNKRRVKELLPVLAEWNARHRRPFTFFTEASLNLADDPELMQMMKEAGFIRVFVGIETPVEASLREAGKLQNLRRSLVESVRRIQRYGMEVMAGFIVGFDSDPEDVFDRQVEFIQESSIPLAMVGLLQALPGTQLYCRLQREGRIVNEGQGDNTQCSLNFIPRIGLEQLVEGYRSVLRRIYDRDAYYDRVRSFLAQYHPAQHARRSISDYLALVRSLLRQGIFSDGRASYWKFVLEAATRYRHAFDTAITLAIMGHHFQTLTRELTQPE